MIRLFVLTYAFVVLATSLFATTPTQAAHPNDPPWLWYNYFSFNPTYLRDVGWRPCATIPYEEGAAGVAFNNWVSRFGHDTGHLQLLSSCNSSQDSNLRVWARAAQNVHAYCNDEEMVACYKRISYDSSGGNSRIYRAYIVFDFWWFDHESAGVGLALLAHEFGHGMGLGHPNDSYHVCGSRFVMSYAGCTDLVNNGPYPNDVCVPDSRMGYGSLRC